MIFAITFCLITTKMVVDKPNMYASPPPVHRQFDDYPPSLIPPPTPDSQDHLPSHHKSPPSPFNEQEVLNFLNALPPYILIDHHVVCISPSQLHLLTFKNHHYLHLLRLHRHMSTIPCRCYYLHLLITTSHFCWVLWSLVCV